VVAEVPSSLEPKRVLLVDDERALLPLLERYLRKLGYEPTCFYDPHSALEAFHTAESAFDLVMTDLTLEGISGEELAKAVLAATPRIGVVVMSGYPYSTENFDEADRGRVTFLQKPFLPQQFQAAVERLTLPAAVEEASAPAEETAAPAEETSAQTGETSAPVEESSAPAGETAAEAGDTSAEAEETDARAVETTAQAGETEDEPPSESDTAGTETAESDVSRVSRDEQSQALTDA
jgi:DNA-binding NtrC family response regulator